MAVWAMIVPRPQIQESIRRALLDLGLERVAVVHHGEKRFALAERVEAVPLGALAEPEGIFGP